MGAVSLENDLARIKVDALNTAASNVVLKQRLDAMTAELRGKDELVQRYETEIRRRNDEIEKKELAISNLGRKLDAMKAKAGVDAANSKAADEEAMGPLEATIRQLRAEIETKAAESAEMQRQWIRGQTELVTLENDNVSAAAAALAALGAAALAPRDRRPPAHASRVARAPPQLRPSSRRAAFPRRRPSPSRRRSASRGSRSSTRSGCASTRSSSRRTAKWPSSSAPCSACTTRYAREEASVVRASERVRRSRSRHASSCLLLPRRFAR